MQSNKRGDFYLATGEGGATCPETISKGYSSPVRYDTQRPTELEPTWHPRSFSEHSCLNQNTRPQVGFNDLPTVFPKTVSSQSDQQGDLRWTPSGYITEAQSEPLRRR
ncbi:hypothetical protein TSMEX_005491 [Taenia solium]|eukprot:TsM_000030500 transcript=TsM_000030500 gene=TsM_000030500